MIPFSLMKFQHLALWLCDTKETTKINLEANSAENLACQRNEYFIIIMQVWCNL